jgi:hypothetical protein
MHEPSAAMLVLQTQMYRSQPTKEERVGKDAHRCPQPQSSRSINTHGLPEHECTRVPTGHGQRQTDARMAHMKREHTKHGNTTHTERQAVSPTAVPCHSLHQSNTRPWAIHTAHKHRTHLKHVKGLERNPNTRIAARRVCTVHSKE